MAPRVAAARSSFRMRDPSPVPVRVIRPVARTGTEDRAVRRPRFVRRAWSRRGRRGQVAAVSTVLGLLLVVTVLGNYLTTQLPAQMATNDANHVLEVENQVARLAGSMASAINPSTIGRVLVQPISLGTVGAPPFARPDGAVIGPGSQGGGITDSFTVTGGSGYAPPAAGPAGGATYPACSTQTSTTLVCTTSKLVVWNFSSSSPTSFSVTTSGGPYYINFSTSGSLISYTASSSAPDSILIVGNNDTLTITMAGTSDVLRIVILGNNDVVTFAAGSWTTSTVTILIVGNFDTVNTGTNSMTSSALVVTSYGSHDVVSLGTTSLSSSSIRAYFNGFAAGNPSATCPVDNLAASTDTVYTNGSTSVSGTSSFTVTWNDTSVNSGTAPPSPWSGTYGEPASFACPFYTTVTIPQRSSGSAGASLVVYLRNTYTPGGEVGFDQGAVLYAQSNGMPLMLVNPSISFVGGTLSVWEPEFLGTVGTEAGIGTAELSVRLVSLMSVNLPAAGYSLSGATSLVVKTPFASAWMSYFNGTSSLAGHAVCVPVRSSACTGHFSFNGPLATVYLNVTARALSIQVASYALTLT